MGSQLGKPFKILIAVEFVLIIAIIALDLIDNKEVTGYAVKDSPGIENTDFKILTKAVCEERDGHIYCRDELFVRCNGNEHIINDKYSLAECNGIKLNLSDIDVNGSTKFKKEWADPRRQT